MARKQRDPEFFDCHDCHKVTLLTNAQPDYKCPGCGSANGEIISSDELERRVEEGGVFSIDLSPNGRDKAKRQ